MHVLGRNEQAVWYSNPTGVDSPILIDGRETGEYQKAYGTPTKIRASFAISSGANNLGSQGMAELQKYGITTAYTHRMVTHDLKCPVNEESLIWYGIEPGTTYDAVPHNFKVVRNSRSLNHMIYYLKECDVSVEAPTDQAGGIEP